MQELSLLLKWHVFKFNFKCVNFLTKLWNIGWKTVWELLFYELN